MRSRSPQRNRPPAKRHSLRQRSRSSSTPGRKKEAEDGGVRSRNEGHSHRGRGQKEALRKREFSSKHHGRRRKDSSDPEQEQKGVGQKDGSRKRSRSPNPGTRRSRSKSLDRKRSRDSRHGKKRMKHRSKSEEAGAKNRSRKRSGSRKRSRSPEQKRKARKSDMLEEKQSQMPARQDGGDSFGVRKQTPLKKRSDQTRLTLSERFSQFCDSKPVVLDESISIEIERNIDGDEPFVIPNFHPHEVHLLRRNDEGRKPLSSRTEFVSSRDEEPEEEYAEKRVVTVMKSRNRETASEAVWYRLGQASRGANEASTHMPTLFWKDVGRETVIQVPIITSDRARDAETEVTSASERLGRRVVQTRSDPEIRRSGVPEPQFRDRRRFGAFREDPNLRQTNSQDQDSRFFRGAQGRRRPMEKFRGKVTSSVVRGAKLPPQEEEKNQPVELPDFSRRPDKYSYDSWMDKPEMIPRGRSYFEHDNRSEDVPWEVNRGRGRGGFVRGGRGIRGGRGMGGRGMPRFQNTGFRKRSRSVESREWKHDKFEALEDEKPSSTTEK